MITLEEWLAKAKEAKGRSLEEIRKNDTDIYIVYEDDGFIAEWALNCGQVHFVIDGDGEFFVCDDWLFHEAKDCFWNREEAEKRSEEIKEAK